MEIKTTWGPPTTAVVITGEGMLDKTVTFNGVLVTVSVNEPDCLIFLVPSIALGVYDIAVEGQNVSSFTVAYPDATPSISYYVPGADNWYNILGDQFYAGDTTIMVGGIEYTPYVMTPQECAVILPTPPTQFTLVTPIGSVTYNQ